MRIPLYIEFSGKDVLIIGGGGVGTSRAKKFVEAGANVKVLSLEFSDELKKLANEGKVSLIKGDVFNEKNLEKLIAESNLVVVAIPDHRINDIIEKIAKKYKTLINLANDAERTEVVVPFEGEVDGIRFAVTTEGKSGIVARKVKDLFLKVLKEDEEIIPFLKAMEHLKKFMKSSNVPIQMRMKLYFIISSDPEFRELIKKGEVDKARSLAERLVYEYISGKRKIDKDVGLQF
ncbi:MAG TPA: bifunctional precorrin-2 dehydrogenase/sirohydrochlorin ferrochelatase [Archaeoglobus profundus]|nr:bifunctional precorrin-2 dehydrogenase/sirohydrochlorin ferrochelatase [Archaeoglobus profundus]HIP58328.1 bifunctional precorrin-2 dehydrogenase/sirohydrochlorin ferrochelatase [Archaeoglobus profundus]